MKKITLLIAFFAMTLAAFSQQTTPSPTLTKQGYLQKSKHQKTAAWILVAGGAAMIVTGSIVLANHKNKEAENSSFGLFNAYTNYSGAWITVAGLVAAAGSIPLFIAAAKNKRKAISLSFKYETALQMRNSSFVYKTIPSLNLKISL